MRVSKLVPVIAVVGAAALLVGCGPKANDAGGGSTGAAGNQSKVSVLELLHSDAKGSLQKVSDQVTKSNSMAFTMTSKGMGVETKASGKMQVTDPIKLEMTMNVAGQEITARMLGTTMYMQAPSMTSMLGKGKSWIKMDLASAGAAQYSGSVDEMDPSKAVKRMLATGAFTIVGDETVGGVKTVHYTATQSTSAYLDSLDSAGRATKQKSLDAVGVKEVKTDLWVDEQYQLRRCDSVAGAIESTVEFSDYGTAVTVEAPAADQTMDFSDLTKGLGAGLGG